MFVNHSTLAEELDRASADLFYPAGWYLEVLEGEVFVASACHNAEHLLEHALVPVLRMGNKTL